MFDQTSAVTPLPGEMRPANAPAKRKPIRSACRGLVRFGVELRKVVSFQRAVSGGYRRSIYVPESTIAADEQISPAISPQQIAAIADPMRTLGELAGNFGGLEALRTTRPASGNRLRQPLPKKKFLPRKRVGH
jgi:hypothetical protein